MRKTDISRYKKDKNGHNVIDSNAALTGTKGFLSVLWKVVSTLFLILVFTGIVVSISVGIYLFGLANQPTGIDLKSEKLNMTSVVYVQNAKGEFAEYDRLHDVENRIWVNYSDIPKQMKDAMVAIEDKRFEEHHGVDWVRTIGAIFNLSSGEASYGGSTLTQQLIKNISGENEVSINRKLNEIFRALNVERDFTKDEILEAYLNIVNFGSGCQGVQAAANLYFYKDIQDCSIAECAAIAGITQNPSAHTPLIYPENNKKRRELVLDAMYEQGKITKAEYTEAKKESDAMTFKRKKEKKKETKNEDIGNWFMDALIRNVRDDFKAELNLSEEIATNRVYTGGYKIYATMDKELQDYAEDYLLNIKTPYDTNLEIATVVMGLDGRILATVGSRNKKEGMLVWDRANMSVLQPGSIIKPIFPYALAIEKDIYNFSSLVDDTALSEWKYVDGSWQSGPKNVYGSYNGKMTLPEAIEWSSNAGAARTMELVGPGNAYSQAVNKMGFRNLMQPDAENIGALSLGGMNGGTTVTEMAAAYQFMGNGGRYYKPHTYYYVEDHEGNVVLDNRESIPIQSYSPETAYIMNRLLHYNVTMNNPAHTSAGRAKISGWDILGKTGTTDNNYDHWFAGLSPYATCAVWTGFNTPQSMSDSSFYHAVDIFHDLMEKYLEKMDPKDYTKAENLEEMQFCLTSGLLAGSYCTNTYTGYYKKDQSPDYCPGWHSSYSNNSGDYESSYSNNYSSSVNASSWSESEPDTSNSESSWIDPGNGSSSEPESDNDPGNNSDTSAINDPSDTEL